MEAVVSTSRTLNIVRSYECDCPCNIILVELKFIVCGPDPKMCFYTDNVCN
jgi:hypothetical protein